jgi:hypothetical protein
MAWCDLQQQEQLCCCVCLFGFGGGRCVFCYRLGVCVEKRSSSLE